jgi:hypothetical protein
MNFHPDKQLFQVADARDRTTDPWITRPVLYPYSMGTHCSEVLLGWNNDIEFLKYLMNSILKN